MEEIKKLHGKVDLILESRKMKADISSSNLLVYVAEKALVMKEPGKLASIKTVGEIVATHPKVVEHGIDSLAVSKVCHIFSSIIFSGPFCFFLISTPYNSYAKISRPRRAT